MYFKAVAESGSDSNGFFATFQMKVLGATPTGQSLPNLKFQEVMILFL
jgi:hypothetical protein